MWQTKEDITDELMKNIVGPGKKLDDMREGWFTKHLIIALREVIYSLLSVVENVYNNITVKNAKGSLLDDKGYDYGVDRNAAVKARHTVTLRKSAPVSSELPIPDGFLLTTTPVSSNAPVKFTVVPGQGLSIALGESAVEGVIVECAEYGEIGNVPDGAINLVAQAGFDSVTGSKLFAKGVNEEEDDPYRERILARKRRPPKAGVPADWEKWALEVSGVTRPRAFRTARGPGTVDVVIRGPEGELPSEGLILECQKHLDTYTPADMDGEGVLVCAPEVVEVSIVLAEAEIRQGYSVEEAAYILKTAFDSFFSENYELDKIKVVDCIVTARTAYDERDASKAPVIENFTLLEPSSDIALTGRQAPTVTSVEISN